MGVSREEGERREDQRAPIYALSGVDVDLGGRAVLTGVELALTGGMVVALVGPNGAGKSTLLRVLGGDVAPAAGEVLFYGRRLADICARELAGRRAVLPQRSVVQFAFTAREVVEFGRGVAPRHRSGQRGLEDTTLIARAMGETDTLDVAGASFPELSGGEQARVMLARVLAQDTPVLLLDEPTSSLDLAHQQSVLEVARRWAAEGALVVVVLHDLNLAACYADRIVVLDQGEVVADGVPWAVLTEALVGEVFASPVRVTRHPTRDCPLVIPLPAVGEEGGRREVGR
jgi:iron complex transport system ATP-binding protein